MIVTGRESRRITEGRKVQHRLPRSRVCPEIEAVVPISIREPNEALGYDPFGRPRTETKVQCYVRVCARRMETVSAVRPEDITAEGYPHFDDFCAEWPEPTELTWVMVFELEPIHLPRLLTSRVIAGRQGNYVTNAYRALPDEPEAIDPFTQREFSRAGRERDFLRLQERRSIRAKLPFEVRLRALVAEARERHIDIRSELRAIKRWRDPKARERQLIRIQEKLEWSVAV